MQNVLISVLGVVITILLIVGIHEFGHFIVARLVGIKVLTFSIGFGKALFRRQDKKGTEYILAAIPLGGYVKMLDESEGEVKPEDLHAAYNRQPIYKRFAVVAAGPLTNLIFAFILYWFLFFNGFMSMAPIISSTTPNSIAANAGMKSQQEIISVDNKPTISWMSVMIRILSRTGDTGQLHLTTRNISDQTIQTYTLDLSQWHMDELKPDPLKSLGLNPFGTDIPLVIGVITPNSPAEKAKLKVGDKILAMGNTKVSNWDDLIELIESHPDTSYNMTIMRNNKQMILPITTGLVRGAFFQKYGFLGIAPTIKFPDYLIRKVKFGPIEALPYAWQNTVDFSYLNLLLIGKLFTGKVSLKSLGGPITIFSSAGTAFSQGLTPFISFLAFLSIAIGIINILPIPGLDGGHVLFQLCEFIMRRPISLQWQELFYRLGFILLILVLVQAIVNDVLRL